MSLTSILFGAKSMIFNKLYVNLYYIMFHQNFLSKLSVILGENGGAHGSQRSVESERTITDLVVTDSNKT